MRVQLSISEILGHTSLEVFIFPVSRTHLREEGKFNKYFCQIDENNESIAKADAALGGNDLKYIWRGQQRMRQ